MDFLYPSNRELREIEQELLPRLMENRLGFEVMPMREVDAALLEWEQEDNWTGLQQLRGLGGEPPRVKKVGGKKYQAQPGVYGEFDVIDEVELTLRRQYGTAGTPVNISDLVSRSQTRLLQRRLDRIEYIIWSLLAAGTFSVASETGVVHTDAYSLQTANAAVAWGTFATAKPLADYRSIQLLGRGKSVSFGADAKAIMNRVTANKLLANTNANDLAGKRTQGLGSLLSLPEVNMLLTGEGLPNIVVYDEGYLNDAGTFVPYIADDKVIVVGRRPGGRPVAEYALTRNANNPDLGPGPYTKIVDNVDRDAPREIAVHDGHNGGPQFYFPSAVVILTTS